MSTPQDPFATPPEGGSSSRPPSGPASGASASGAPAAGGYGDPGGRPQGGSNGMGIASLVLGLLAVFTALFVLPALLGIIAIVLGVVALGKVKRGEASSRALPISGIVTGALSVVIAGAVIAAGAAFFNSDTGRELTECLEDAAGDPAAEAQCEQQFEDSLTG